jgi:hypothetical protein
VKTWRGNDLVGAWTVTRKIDGVQVIYKDGVPRSRRDKPLYNLPRMPDGVYEVFMGSWEKTVSRVRTHLGIKVERRFLYRLSYPFDKRLVIRSALVYPVAGVIRELFKKQRARGHEGLVLHPWPHGSKGEPLKVKQRETYDVKVTGIQMGKGKHAGRLGAVLTEKGKVGTGFNDAQRCDLLVEFSFGKTVIEVECTGLTPGGKFREPRFVRVRFDK